MDIIQEIITLSRFSKKRVGCIMRKAPEDFYILYRDNFYERFKRAYLRPFAKVEAWYGFMTFVYQAMRVQCMDEDDLDQFDEEQYADFRTLLPALSDCETCELFDDVAERIANPMWDGLFEFPTMLEEIYNMEDHLYTFREFAKLSKQVDNIDENELLRLDFTDASITFFNRLQVENERRRRDF